MSSLNLILAGSVMLALASIFMNQPPAGGDQIEQWEYATLHEFSNPDYIVLDLPERSLEADEAGTLLKRLDTTAVKNTGLVDPVYGVYTKMGKDRWELADCVQGSATRRCTFKRKVTPK